MFGSGRAILSLRESYRRDLRDVKQATDFKYIRFHAILNDEVGVYDEDARGSPLYNFSYIDQIYDGLLENGVRPFVELSFMPSKLAANQTLQSFWYKPIVSPPKSWEKWSDLISHLAQHLLDRYGIDEVSQWYFEVWNEPNLDFWAGDPKEQSYFQLLYDVAARALEIRQSPAPAWADPRLRKPHGSIASSVTSLKIMFPPILFPLTFTETICRPMFSARQRRFHATAWFVRRRRKSMTR